MRVLLCFFCIFLSSCVTDISQEPIQANTITITVIDVDQKQFQLSLERDSTIQDVLDQVHCSQCDLTRMNPLTKLYQNDVVILYPIVESCISINQATLDELDTLSGIGPSIAQRILDYRTTYGLFQRLEDIMLVKGIKEKLFQTIQTQICL